MINLCFLKFHETFVSSEISKQIFDKSNRLQMDRFSYNLSLLQLTQFMTGQIVLDSVCVDIWLILYNQSIWAICALQQIFSRLLFYKAIFLWLIGNSLNFIKTINNFQDNIFLVQYNVIISWIVRIMHRLHIYFCSCDSFI